MTRYHASGDSWPPHLYRSNSQGSGPRTIRQCAVRLIQAAAALVALKAHPRAELPALHQQLFCVNRAGRIIFMFEKHVDIFALFEKR
jgi:hypothetical protein